MMGLPAIKKLRELCAVCFALLLLSTCLGCQTASNLPSTSSNTVPDISSGLSNDLTLLLKEQAKTTLYEPKYHMVGDSGLGICEFKALPQDINTIANALNMTEIKSDKTLKYIHYDEKNSKLGTLFCQGRDIRVCGIFGQPDKLKCKSGKTFAYMLIFYRPETNEASIETCYSAK